MRDPTFKQVVENVLDTCPWQTIQQIREKCQARGIGKAERVQAQIDLIKKTRIVRTRPHRSGNGLEYALGGESQNTKLGGFEVDFRVIDGEIRATVKAHNTDLYHLKLATYVQSFVNKIEANLEARGRGLLFEAASDLGLLNPELPDFDEDYNTIDED